jgi:hypothetical protein
MPSMCLFEGPLWPNLRIEITSPEARCCCNSVTSLLLLRALYEPQPHHGMWPLAAPPNLGALLQSGEGADVVCAVQAAGPPPCAQHAFAVVPQQAWLQQQCSGGGRGS